MNQKDLNRLTMWRAVATYLTDNGPVWAHVKPFANAKEGLDGAISEATAIIEAQAPTTTGLTASKAALEQTALAKVVSLGRSTKAYALATGDMALYAKVNYAKDDIMHLPEMDAVATMRAMLTAIAAAGKGLEEYGVSSTGITEANAAIDAFETAVPKARVAIVTREAAGDGIAEIRKEARLVLAQMDNLIHLFEDQNPEFRAGYLAARRVLDAGVRHEKPEPPTAA